MQDADGANREPCCVVVGTAQCGNAVAMAGDAIKFIREIANILRAISAQDAANWKVCASQWKDRSLPWCVCLDQLEGQKGDGC